VLMKVISSTSTMLTGLLPTSIRESMFGLPGDMDGLPVDGGDDGAVGSWREKTQKNTKCMLCLRNQRCSAEEPCGLER